MTVWFNKARDRWMFGFKLNGQRYSGYALDEAGAPVTSERAAKEAREVARRKARIAPKLPRGEDMTIAQVATSLTPFWKRQARWPNIQRFYLPEILKFFGPARPVVEIDQELVDQYRAFCIAVEKRVWAGGPKRDARALENAKFWRPTGEPRGPHVANLYFEILRQIIAKAATLRDPVTRELIMPEPPSVPKLQTLKRKARPIPDNVLSEILEDLPQHAREAVVLTLLFGFRRGEAFSLQIHNVDRQARGVRLFAEDVKDSEDTFLPAGAQGVAYLEALITQAEARGVRYLVTYRPYRKDPAEQAKLKWAPIEKPRSAWARVMDAVEERHGRRWRWHDIRAAFITDVAIGSGSALARALARHSDQDTTDLYVEVADTPRREAAQRTEGRPALLGYFKQYPTVKKSAV